MEEREKQMVSAEEKAFVEKIHFGQGEKSSADYINAYTTISIYSQLGNFEKMKVVKTYKEYFENSPYVLELSDKETVKKIDELVSEFNSDLDRIKEEKDIEAVKDFLDKIGNLMKEKK